MDQRDMPCGPQDITVLHYGLPNFGRGAHEEEAAARILKVSQENGCWVGVSLGRLFDVMEEEFQRHRDAYSEVNHVHVEDSVQRMNQYREDCQIFDIISSALQRMLPWHVPVLAKGKVLPLPEELPNSLIFSSEPYFLPHGIERLADMGFVQITDVDGESVVFPTAKLISHVHKTQKPLYLPEISNKRRLLAIASFFYSGTI